MTTFLVKPFMTTLPSLGECTLLPHSTETPYEHRTYTCLYEVGKLLGLKELPKLSHNEIQAIFKILAHGFSDTFNAEGFEIRILLSGMHFSYPSIDIRNPGQKPVPCVTSMVITFWNKKNMFDMEQSCSKHFEMFLDEVPIDEVQQIEGPGLLYSIFQGVPQKEVVEE